MAERARTKSLEPVTDEQVFYDKFSYDKFYLPSTRVYMQHILYDKFSYDKFYFTGVNVSTSFTFDKFTLTIRWPIASNAQITLTSFLC